MTPKEFLNRGYRLHKRMETIDYMLDEFNGLSANALDAVRVQGGKGNPAERRMDRIAELVDKYKAVASEYAAIQAEAEQAIAELPHVGEATVLDLRYIRFKLYREIAEELTLDERWVKRLHARGLEHIAETETFKKFSEQK